MTVKEFYESKENVLNDLEKYISFYKNNETASDIINSGKKLKTCVKYLSSVHSNLLFKHICLILFISLLISMPFFVSNQKFGINIFVSTFGVLIVLTLFLCHIIKCISHRYVRFDKLNEDIKTRNIDAIKNNHEFVKTVTNKNKNINGTKIETFINNFYFNGKFLEFNEMYKNFSYYLKFDSIMQILHNMMNNIIDVCGNIYIKQNLNEDLYLDEILKTFGEKFFNSVFTKTTFCEDPKLNKFMGLFTCYYELYDVNKSERLLIDFDDLDESMKLNLDKYLKNYGLIGEQVVCILIAEYGLKLIERDSLLTKNS